MTLMRMNVADIQRRVAMRAERGYLFTMSKWHAMAYVSDRLIIEDAYVDPNTVFPPWVMKSVHYGMKYGVQVDVLQYLDGGVQHYKPVGALMRVSIGRGEPGEHELGYYAVRYS